MHVPVLLNEMLSALNPQNAGVYIDATFGAGGYTTAILEKANCKVIAFDRDPNVMSSAQAINEKYGERFTFVNADFASIQDSLKEINVDAVDGIVMDIGVSSMQIDNAWRGFSFYQDGPLDMRMDPRSGISAAEVINTFSEKELADIIFTYGDERYSRKIAKLIVETRTITPFKTTKQLSDLVKKVVWAKHSDIHPATRTFQALRIFVNDELNQLQKALKGSKNIIVRGGRLVVVTFHSGEDRIVKQFFNNLIGKTNQTYSPFGVVKDRPEFKLCVKNSITPTEDEITRNLRARSAKLRAVERI